MFHYIIKVPSDGEEYASQKTVASRLDTFNDSSRFLLFDGGDDAEKRFIMVCDDKVSDDTMTKLNGIFEREVKAEEIEREGIDNKKLKRINITKELMVAKEDNSFRGDRTTLFVTESCDQLLGKASAMIGSKEFKSFLTNFSKYIDQTAEMKAAAMYNIVLVNKSGACLDQHIELLCGMLAAKSLLLEQAMIKGDIYDARYTDRETQLAYVIEDDWKIGDDDDSDDDLLIDFFCGNSGKSYETTEKIKLFKKIRNSRNIYMTSMTKDEYDKVSKLDGFSLAFPHIVTIEEFSEGEKIESISSIAGEYGFSFDEDGFTANTVVGKMSMNEIETAVRNAIQQKLITGDSTFLIGVSDLGIEPESPKKTSAFDDLENLIGLGSVKKIINEIVTFLKKKGRDAVPCLHMAFLGNPGTGKTTVARIIAKLFAETGISKKDIFVETQRGGLVAEYMGQTAPKTARVIERAMGGVLFIDEAYALIERDDDLFGEEVLATLVKIMEDRRGDFVCILAGYPDEMNAMLDMNPGLRDRIQFYIDFPDYSRDELMQVFMKLCKDNKYVLSSTAKRALDSGFAQLLKASSKNFSNGRLVRKIFERAYIKQAQRTDSNVITEKDIAAVFAEPDFMAMMQGNQTKIGFAA